MVSSSEPATRSPDEPHVVRNPAHEFAQLALLRTSRAPIARFAASIDLAPAPPRRGKSAGFASASRCSRDWHHSCRRPHHERWQPEQTALQRECDGSASGDSAPPAPLVAVSNRCGDRTRIRTTRAGELAPSMSAAGSGWPRASCGGDCSPSRERRAPHRARRLTAQFAGRNQLTRA